MGDVDCSFCAENNFIINGNNLFTRYLADIFDQSRFFFDNFIWNFMPTIGCFIEGYILAVNKLHYSSLYHCPLEDKGNLINEFDLIKRIYSDVFKSKFIFFEHGIVKENYQTACCVDHVHIHFIPFPKVLWDTMLSAYKFKYFPLSNLYDVDKVINDNDISSYLLFGDIDENIYLIDASKNIYPSQFFRMIVFRYYYPEKENGWDWRKDQYIGNMFKTYNLCKGYIENNYLK